MNKTSKNPQPASPATATCASESKTKSNASPDCQRCVDNLLSTLNAIQSKPIALFQAMGVNVASYEQNDTGVQVRVPASVSVSVSVTGSSPSPSRSDEHSPANNQSQPGFGGMLRKQSSSLPNNHEYPKKKSNDHDRSVMVKLKRRLTQSLQNTHKPPVAVATSAIETTTGTHTDANTTETVTKPAMVLQIQCKKCSNEGPEGGARAFVRGPNPLSMVLCSNRLSTQAEIEQVLIHELIHVYDVHVRDWDLTNCYTLAKSEVRAAREAECADSSMSFTKRFCVKEKARVATKNMFPDLGLQCVGAAFEEAMRDHAPFEKQGESGSGNGFGFGFEGRSFESTYPSDKRE